MELPNLANATPEFLADELGDVRSKSKDLKKLEGYFKEALKGRIDFGETATGDRYSVQRSKRVQRRIDTTSIKEEMGSEWYDEHCKNSEQDVLSTALIET